MHFISICRIFQLVNLPSILLIWRSRRSQMFFKIRVLKNFANFTGKHLCWSLFLIKLQDLSYRPTLLKKDFNTGVFLWKLQKFLSRVFVNKVTGLQLPELPTLKNLGHWNRCFFCEFCGICRKRFLVKHLQVTTFEQKGYN